MQDVGMLRHCRRSEPVDLRQRVHWHAVFCFRLEREMGENGDGQWWVAILVE